MMNRYPVLKATVTLIKIIAVLSGGAIMVLGVMLGVLGNAPIMVFVSIIGGAWIGITMWASAEFIQMLMNMSTAVTVGKNAMVKMYIESKRGDE